MKKIRRLFGVIFIIAALVTMQLPGSEANAAAAASDFVIEDGKLTKYKGTGQYVVVPDTVEVIAESAFSDNDNLVQISFSDSVKMIEPFSFWGCDKLQTVLLGKGIKVIDDYAFANCKGLQSMVLPSGVSSIGVCSFMDCVNLVSIYIPDSVWSIHESTFNGCFKTIIQCPEGSYAKRYAAGLYERQKEMPEYEDVSNYQPNPNEENKGTETDKEKEQDSQGTTVVPQPQDTALQLIGSSHIVGNQAVVFINTDTVKVYSGSEGISGMSGQNDQSGQSAADGEGTEGEAASAPVEEIPPEPILADTEVIPKTRVVNGSVIADQAYYRATGLGMVMIPAGIQEIGEFAYARSDLKSVTVPEGVEEIGYGAFYHCDELKNVRLPESIRNVSPKAFQYTRYVTDFMEKGSSSGDFLISGSSLIAYRGNAAEVVIPDTVKVIAGEVFKDHAEIEKVTIPEGLYVIGEGAFENCSSLQEVVFGYGITDIKDRAFSGCGLRAITVPASLQRLGLYAFDDHVSGNIPASIKRTHEPSAERLSNESYRRVEEESGQGGVDVIGVEGIRARLEGAQRRYTLIVSENTNTTEFLNVYRKTTGKEFSADCPIYEMNLTDSSAIPITRLGKQLLYVTIPLDEVFEGYKAKVLTLDRNGQLEIVPSERVIMGGKDCIRMAASHLSSFGIMKSDEKLDENEIRTVSTTMYQAAGPMPAQSVFTFDRVKLAAAAFLFLIGVLLIFRSTKRFVK